MQHLGVLSQYGTLCGVDQVGFSDSRWFQAFFLLSPVPQARVGTDGCFVLVNDAFCSLLGYARTELEGRPFKWVTHPEDVDGDEASLQAVLRGEIESYSMIKRYLTKPGKQVWVTLSVRAIRGPGNVVECFAVYAAPLPNHGKFKVERHEDELVVRPSVRLGELAKDNHKALLAVAGVTVPVLGTIAWKLFRILDALMRKTGITW